MPDTPIIESNPPPAPFADRKYLSLETYRKSGEGVATTVWFVLEGSTLCMRTFSNMRKV